LKVSDEPDSAQGDANYAPIAPEELELRAAQDKASIFLSCRFLIRRQQVGSAG
jgi:hypothetical protein